MSVIVGVEQILIEEALRKAEVDVLLRVHDVELARKGAQGELCVVEHAALAVVAPRARLCRHEHYAVTCLCTVDCGRGGILEDLDGLDHLRVEVLDVVDLQTVHDEQGPEVSGV